MYWPVDHLPSPRLTFSITSEPLSVKTGPALVGSLPCFLDLSDRIARAVHVKRRRRRRPDAALTDLFLLLLWHLSDVDATATDRLARRVHALEAVPSGR